MLEGIKETISNCKKETDQLKDSIENKFEELRLDLNKEELKKVQRNELNIVENKIKSIDNEFKERLEIKMDKFKQEVEVRMKTGFESLMNHQKILTDQVFDKVKGSLNNYQGSHTDRYADKSEERDYNLSPNIKLKSATKSKKK